MKEDKTYDGGIDNRGGNGPWRTERMMASLHDDEGDDLPKRMDRTMECAMKEEKTGLKGW